MVELLKCSSVHILKKLFIHPIDNTEFVESIESTDEELRILPTDDIDSILNNETRETIDPRAIQDTNEYPVSRLHCREVGTSSMI